MTIEDKPISIEDLIALYNAGHLHKPDFQRDKQWTDAHNLDFLLFTFKMQHVLTPFLCTEHYVVNGANENTRIYSLFDGNNRINAIIDFYQCPMKYLKPAKTAFDAILQSVSDTECCKIVCNNINAMSYNTLYCTPSLREICKSEDSLWEWYRKNDDRDGTIENAYSRLHTEITQIKFNQIKLNFKIFSNLSSDEIINIFKNINTSGIQLSDQDLLKATCSLTFYYANEITMFSILLDCMRTYIADKNTNEKLNARLPDTQMSSYQILFSLQLYLHNKYPYIIDAPGASSDGVDIIFILYKHFYDDPKIKNCVYLNTFIDKINTVFVRLNDIYKKLFGIVSSADKPIKMFGSGGKNKILIIIANMIHTNISNNNIAIIILYNRLCGLLKNYNDGSEETVALFALKNPIKYVADNGVRTLRKISANNDPLETPSKQDMEDLLYYLVKNSYEPCAYEDKKRQYKPTILESIILNVYFYARIPPILADQTLNLDHIIPIGLKGWTNPLDINCLGNKMLIPRLSNQKKSNQPITEEFLQEHGLDREYINYISSSDYNKIVCDDIIDSNAFGAYCNKREKQYINGIIQCLYQG